jgi:osmotically-inducible protein OsmY
MFNDDPGHKMMFNKRFTALPVAVTAIVAAFTLVACDDEVAAPRIAAVAPVASAASQQDIRAQAAQDAALSRTIEARLKDDAGLDVSKIDIDISKGRVVLRGVVPAPEARQQAELLAKNVQGVVSVNNMLSVHA